MSTPIRRRTPLVIAAALAAPWLACIEGPPDPMLAKCSVAVEYRHPELKSIDIAVVRRSASGITLDFEGVNKETKDDYSDRILCEFAPGDRYALARIVLHGETLSESEVALVNSELLLRELGGEAAGS
jgi:hypothetical protein